jgi:hypothetical protein
MCVAALLAACRGTADGTASARKDAPISSILAPLSPGERLREGGVVVKAQSETERLATTLATWPVHVGATNRGAIVAEEALPAGTTVTVGSRAGCNVRLPAAVGVDALVVAEARTDGIWLKLPDDARVQANVEIAGEEVALRSVVAEARRRDPRLGASARLVQPKVIVAFRGLTILLHYDPKFAPRR